METKTLTGWGTGTRAMAVQLANMSGLHKSIGYMPDTPYKHFNEWILEQPELAEKWAQLLGLRATASMTDDVLSSVLSPEQMEKMVDVCVPMTLMLTYEVASDNVAIGLANNLPDDDTRAIRIQLLTQFGDVMVKRLQGDPTETADLLASSLPLVNEISSFVQSLSEHKYHKLLNVYLAQYPDVEQEAIEFSLYEILIANIDCGQWVLETLDGYQMQSFIRDWLVKRYTGQTFLINHDQMLPEELIRASTDAIMVVPTMAYYIAHMLEYVAPNPHLDEVMQDGTLLLALEKCALLVRILNDMGTDVIEQSDDYYAGLIDELRQTQHIENYDSFVELMMDFVPERGDAFTRLKKDIQFGEYNLALHYPRLIDDVDEAIDEFYERLCWISEIYQKEYQELYQLVDEIEMALGTSIAGDLLTRFVEFHRHFYRNSFEGVTGEYGI